MKRSSNTPQNPIQMHLKPARRLVPRFISAAACAALISGLAACNSGNTAENHAPKYPSEEVEIVVDNLGISHVYAKNDADVFYGSGYAMARDRLFQMELWRRQALGRKAEIFGEASKRSDIFSRTINFGALAAADVKHFRAQRPEDAKLLDAWIAGVNQRIAEMKSGEAQRPYGLRDTELNFIPEPWVAEHAFAIGKMLVFSISNSLDRDMLATALLRVVPGTVASLPALMPSFDMYTMHQDDPGKKPGSPPSPAPPPPPLPSNFGKPAQSDAPFFYKPLTPPMASNNWVVAGTHTDNGKPILAGDPHQSLTSPTRLWPLHMNSADAGGNFDVIGFAFIGTPTVELGHNANIGWTATTNFADAMDLWDVAVSPNSKAVKLGGEIIDIVFRDESIRIRKDGAPVGEGEDIAITVREVPGYGVILPEEILPVPRAFLAEGQILLNWTGFKATMEPAAYIDIDRAKNIDEFEAAADLMNVGAVNYLIASKDSIGYHTHADVPDRGDPKTHDMPWHIVSSADKESFWTRGFLPPSKLPHERDPARGFIATANNDPWGHTADGNVQNDDFYYGAFYANGVRNQRIDESLRALIASGNKITHGDMEELQRDVKSLLADNLVPLLGEAIAAIPTDPSLSAYIGRTDLESLAATLTAWDRRFLRSEKAPVIYLGLEWFACKRAFEAAFTPPLFNAIASQSNSTFPSILHNVVTKRFQGSELYMPGGQNAFLLASLDDAAAWLKQRFGSIDAAFTLADVHAAEFSSEYGGELSVDPVSVDGHLDTVNVAYAPFFAEDGTIREQFPAHEMALYRMVVGFNDQGRATATINFARGSREDPNDAHFDSQNEIWSKGEHLPLPFERSDVESKTSERFTLKANK